jgi:hypothetical protein
VRLLHPEDVVLRAMLSGWAKQQLGGRRLERQVCHEWNTAGPAPVGRSGDDVVRLAGPG